MNSELLEFAASWLDEWSEWLCGLSTSATKVRQTPPASTNQRWGNLGRFEDLRNDSETWNFQVILPWGPTLAQLRPDASQINRSLKCHTLIFPQKLGETMSGRRMGKRVAVRVKDFGFRPPENKRIFILDANPSISMIVYDYEGWNHCLSTLLWGVTTSFKADMFNQVPVSLAQPAAQRHHGLQLYDSMTQVNAAQIPWKWHVMTRKENFFNFDFQTRCYACLELFHANFHLWITENLWNTSRLEQHNRRQSLNDWTKRTKR